MFLIPTPAQKQAGRYFFSLLADRTCLARIWLLDFMQANAMWSQLINEMLLHFPEWPIRELLRLFAACPLFLSRVALHSFDVSNIYIYIHRRWIALSTSRQTVRLLLVIQHPCWRKRSLAKRRHSFRIRADSRLQAYKRSQSAFDAWKGTFWPQSMRIPSFLAWLDSLIIVLMFVFRNQKPPDSSPSFTPFRGRETSREKC